MRFAATVAGFGILSATAVAAPCYHLQAQNRVAPAEALRGFDAWAEQVMADWQIPGMAVGVIVDGEAVLTRGFGYADVDAQRPVTERTVMAIGSNSKSFTVVLMGMLVDEDRLDWDTPVRDYLPDFQLHDPFATAEMTPRDLVSHQSGLPRHDNIWYGRKADRPELFAKLRYLEPNASFRSVYQYQNLMFMTAGYLTERITGDSWDDLVDDRIFEPLGMARSNTSTHDTPASGDYALPYILRDGELMPVPFRNIDNVGPAGSINSSVEEMLHYIAFRLNGGEYEGKRLLEQQTIAEMERPQFATEGDMPYPEAGYDSYGLGLRVVSYHGRKLVHHGGGIDGFISSMSWMPDEGIGVMVLTNRSGGSNPVPLMVAYNVYDRLLGEEQVDWNARRKKEAAEQERRAEERRMEMEAKRVAGTAPSRPFESFVGLYEHPAYGMMEVAAVPGGLQIRYDGQVLDLEHFHYDIFRITTPEEIVPVTGLVTFSMSADGSISEMAVPFEPAGAPIVFERRW